MIRFDVRGRAEHYFGLPNEHGSAKLCSDVQFIRWLWFSPRQL